MRLRLRRYQSIPMNSAEEAQVVPIVGDAAIATVGVGHGRLIPLIIIEKWRNELGVDYWNPDHQDRIDRLLADPEWRWLRTDGGTI